MIAILANWRLIVGGTLAIALAASLWWGTNQSNRADTAEAETRILKAELVTAERRTMALERAATERASDTQERTAETDKVSDTLDRIEQKVEANEPVQADAAAVAVQCGRLRRQGQTASAQYRARCR